MHRLFNFFNQIVGNSHILYNIELQKINLHCRARMMISLKRHKNQYVAGSQNGNEEWEPRDNGRLGDLGCLRSNIRL